MPIFKVENSTASTGGVFLLPYPSVDWFSWAILGAVSEMTKRENWVGSSNEEIDYAWRESNRMLEGFKVLAFNPFPIGLILPFGSDTPPEGYLLCDGDTIAIADYPELFSVVGHSFGGSGDDFFVPDLRGKTVISFSGGFPFLSSGGETDHTLTESEIPSHSHTIPLTATTLAVEPGEVTVTTPVPFFTSNTGDTGGDGEHNNMQPFLSLAYIIYAGR